LIFTYIYIYIYPSVFTLLVEPRTARLLRELAQSLRVPQGRYIYIFIYLFIYIYICIYIYIHIYIYIYI